MATAAVAALLAASSFALGTWVGTANTTQASTPTATVAPAQTRPSPTISSGTEPVAAVAAALSDSVVQIRTDQGLGSGIIYDASGLILTAAHVVEGSSQFQVVLADGTRVPATVVGADQSTDVAVMKVSQTGLTPAPLAVGEQLQVGQLAVAIGSPYGLAQSVTAGYVSATARPVQGPDGQYRLMIQTDAAINPGNSGGALANRQGQVIGINDQIFSQSGGNEGLGFAIPIDTAKSVADSLVAGTPIQTALLGIQGTNPTSGRAGALVEVVSPGSPAAGTLQVGDLIVGIDGTPIESFEELAGNIHAHRPGDNVTLDVYRNGTEVTVSVTLGSQS